MLAQAWGRDGHRIVGQIAEAHLSPKAAAAVREILGPERHLADIANIADEVRNQRPETEPWHYVDIPLEAKAFDRARDCPADNCIVGVIERFEAEIRSPGLSPERRYEALYNLVHFVGDLHEPLHCSNHDDHGGNDVKVKFLGQETNLHSVWDTRVIQNTHQTWETLARRLGKVSRGRRAAWSNGTPEEWALESHDLARDVAYRFRPPAQGPVVLDKAYERRAEAVIRQQLAKAGIRLAYILNQAY